MYWRGVDAIDAIVLIGPTVGATESADFLLLAGLRGCHVANATDEPTESAHDACYGRVKVGGRGGDGRRVARG